MLCELLGRTGVATASAHSVGDALVTLSRTAVKVLFIDADAFQPSELSPLVEAAARRGAATVVAGTNRPVGEFGFVRKPYHYRELVHKIWAALEATPGKAANMSMRSSLLIAIEQHVRGWNVTQVEAARHLGITQPRLNDLLKGRISSFSLDMLVNLAGAAGLTVRLEIDEAA